MKHAAILLFALLPLSAAAHPPADAARPPGAAIASAHGLATDAGLAL